VTSSGRAALLRQVTDLARGRFGWSGELESEMRLVQDLGLDSLKLMELAVTIENHFQIRIDEASEVEIVTVGDLVDIIEQETSGRAAEPE
jgi:acyl carrier protein